MIELMEEKIISINEFRKMSLYELKNLREKESNRWHWRLNTENYDKKKMYYLRKNGTKITQVILEKIQ